MRMCRVASRAGWVYEGDEEEGERLVWRVKKFREKVGVDDEKERERELEERIRSELMRVLEWCRLKFGDGAWVDASEAWTRDSDEVRKVKSEMVSGGEGWRKF